MGINWVEQPIHFVDFEGNQSSGIVEFGVATVHRGEIADARTRLCRPTGRIRGSDTAVHGLAEEQLTGEAPFGAEWEYFAALRERGPLAAHFAGAENSLIKSVWPYPRQCPDFARPGEQSAAWGPWVDTAALYGQLYPGLPSRQLDQLVAAVGLQTALDEAANAVCAPDRRHFHAALYDALAGALLLARLAEDPQLASLSVMQLLALSTLDGAKRDALQQRELF